MILSLTYCVINAKYKQISSVGKTVPDVDWIDFDNLTEVQKIALKQIYYKDINLLLLQSEIQHWQRQPELHWVKSHYYDTDLFNDITIDIVVDDYSLPFVVNANCIKTDTLSTPFNNIVSKIPDETVKLKYTYYCNAVDTLVQTNIGWNTILVSELIAGQDQFESVLARQKLNIPSEYFVVYNDWLEKNLPYMPSETYTQKIYNRDYDYNDTKLSLVEKYCLLALSKNKFTIL